MTDYGTKLRKLRDLIEDIGEEFCSDTATTCDYHTYIADRLLYNGVILPPCKVGDTVYVMWKTCDIDEFIVSGYHISHTKDGEKTNSREFFECKAVRNPKISLALNVSGLGKTVFLTREEAEAALEKLGTEVNNDR